MKLSKMHLKTLREVPNEAEIPSHILLLRTGMIRKLVSGVYGFMPLGWRSVRKIEDIIREEMDAAGGQEIHMSAVQPAELWEESGRWFAYGPELWRLKDRNGREFCLGPTHEEIFTDIIRNDVSSYRQLPLNLYQIQTKYRDEARPRFGLMRSREFIMKDAYSFDRDYEGLDKSYQEMYEAYEKIFTRCGLTFRPVEADTGAIGGSNSHEFTALSEVGESEIAYCEKCSMAATTERAECVDAAAQDDIEMLPMEEVHTPGTKTIEEVASFLGIGQEQTIKALLFVTYDNDGKENGYVAAFVRGDRELNMTKLVNALDIPEHEITAFIGPSGCGKSTFLKCLNRMNDLVEGCRITGSVTLDQEDIYGDMDINVLRKRVGMVFQKPNPFPMSVYDNIAYGPRTHGIRNKAKLDEIVETSLRQAAIWDELKDRLKKSALGLSGGQQQRLCIARALAVEPEVILMDEPTSALDPISTSKIEDLAIELKEKYTIVMVTHNMQQATRISDHTVFFLLGEIIEAGKTEQLFSMPKDQRTEDYITGRFG